MNVTVSNETILLVIKFKLSGNLRFLSHAETLKLFQQACVRAGINMQYSRGFNPRPKLSLPLPRTVAVASDDDLLCLRINESTGNLCATVGSKLSAQLPMGCELLSVEAMESSVSFQPTSATYILPLSSEYISRRVKDNVECVLASERLNIRRRIDEKSSKFKIVDVRPFLKSIKINDRQISVQCGISPDGTIRVDEILKLLELDAEMLTAPIRRTNVEWLIN